MRSCSKISQACSRPLCSPGLPGAGRDRASVESRGDARRPGRGRRSGSARARSPMRLRAAPRWPRARRRRATPSGYSGSRPRTSRAGRGQRQQLQAALPRQPAWRARMRRRRPRERPPNSRGRRRRRAARRGGRAPRLLQLREHGGGGGDVDGLRLREVAEAGGGRGIGEGGERHEVQRAVGNDEQPLCPANGLRHRTQERPAEPPREGLRRAALQHAAPLHQLAEAAPRPRGAREAARPAARPRSRPAPGPTANTWPPDVPIE